MSRATRSSILESDYSAFHDALNDGTASCEARVEEELANARRYNRDLNAFITLLGGKYGLALSRARVLDGRLLAGRGASRASGLFGIPLAIKDNFFFGGFPTTGATFYFRDFVPATNAELVDEAMGLGCVPLGKTNMHELALGATSAASYFGPVRNPYDRGRVAGGSSGGSAVAVAAAKGPVLGLGSDTGGSVRVPAALCGIMGFKPTLGTLSLEGVFPLSATLDHAGLLTRTMPDMIRAFGSLTGRRAAASGAHGRRLRVGVPSKQYVEGSEERVAGNFWAAMERMEESGRFDIVELRTDPDHERFVRARGAIQLREAAWFYETLVKSDAVARRVNPDVLALLNRGLRIGQFRYLEANLVRLESVRVFARLLKGLDALAMPTTMIVAPKLSDVQGNEAGDLRRQLLHNTEVFNLCGFPALSVPSNPGAEELPTAIQFTCGLGEDDLALRVGEQAVKAIAR